MNSITVHGRLAADSELRYTPAGDAILNFRVADDVGFGEKKSTNWWACSLFGKRGETLAPMLLKGQQVVVFGMAQMREWTNKEGVKQVSPDIRVNEISLAGGKPEGQPAQQSRQQAPSPKGKQQFDGDSDIPF